MRGRDLVAAAALLLLPLLQSSTRCCNVGAKCVLFNFGDSNSDTGSLPAAFGFYLGPPAGRRFFHRPTGRWSDGRLYIDFICERLKVGYMSPYLESSGANFTHGVNFAVAGATVSGQQGAIPLTTQVNQFLHFKNRTRELRPLGSGSMISEEEFGSAVYSLDIGQNDITLAFLSNSSYPHVVEALHAAVSQIRDTIQLLYESGAHKFWIYNTGPLGCLPQTLSLRKKPDSKLDPLGCLVEYNSAAKEFNAILAQLCNHLQTEYKNATVVCTDMYRIKYDLFANYTKYGFQHPLMACCGHGGPPYNYVNLMTCGQPTATACPMEARYISWDGVHYTEDANMIVASKILSAKYSKPRIKLTALCK